MCCRHGRPRLQEDRHRRRLEDLSWDALEAETTKWIRAFRQTMTASFPLECEHRLLCPPARCLVPNSILSFLTFPEALLIMTKRSVEKLFKMLDLYEALQDMIPKIENLLIFFQEPEEEELASEMSSVQSRLGETAVAIFCHLDKV